MKNAHLYDGIHETCVSEVGQAADTGLSPFRPGGLAVIVAKIIVSGTDRGGRARPRARCRVAWARCCLPLLNGPRAGGPRRRPWAGARDLVVAIAG